VGRKWSRPSKVFAVLGVVCAMAAFSMVRGYAAKARRLTGALGQPVAVEVTTRALARGTVLTGSMLRQRTYPSAYAPPGALRDPDAVAGLALLTSMPAGAAVTADRLAPKGAGPVAALVPPGLRAVSLPSSLPSGAVRAGDRIDVLAVFPGPHAHTETVAEGVEVLRVMSSDAQNGPGLANIGSSSSAATSLMVLVTQDQEEEFAYARAFAALSISLDGPEEVVAAQAP
jgi:Flp pilus assembly protein CpaB